MCQNLLFVFIVVNYDTNGNFTTILSKIKEMRTEVGGLSNETHNFIKVFKETREIKNLDNVDKNVVKLANDLKSGKISAKQFDEAIDSASKSSFKFASTLKSVAANIGIMLAINAVIKIATTLWDNFNTTVEEAQANLNETQSVISDLKAQITELESIDANALTQGQKDKLQNLKDQLEVQEQLEEIEKRRLARERVGNGNWADYFDEESYAHASVEIERALNKYERDKNRRVIQYNNANEDVALKTVTLNSMKTNGMSEDVIEYQEKQLEKAVDEQRKSQENILELQNDLITQKAEVQSWLTEIQGYIEDGSLVGSDLTKAKEDIVTLNGQLETINKELEYTNTLLYGGDDSWQNVITEKTKYSVENLLDNGFTEEELQILATLTFDKNASLVELREVLDASKDTVEDFGNEMSISYSTITTAAENASKSVDTLRNSISSVTQAFKEQSENGQISVDTMLSMVEAGHATALQFDATTGACTINRDAMLDLVRAKIENQIRDLEYLQTDIQTKLKEDGITAQESANGFYDLAKAKLASASVEQMLSMEQFNDATAQINALQNAMKNLDKIGKGTYSTNFSSATKATGDAEKATKEYIDSYMTYMEESLKSGRIDYETYKKEVSAMLKGMYDDGKIAAKDYHIYTKQMLETQKDAMDAVISAVTYRLDKEIKSYQDQIESVEERYESEIEYLDTVIKYYEDQKKALQDTNDEIDRQLALEQAIYNFERAQSQRTKKLYIADKGIVYTTDTEALRNASDEVRKAKLDIEIAKLDDAIEKVEQQKEVLQDAMDKEKEALQEIISRLEDYRDKWEEITKEYEIRQNEMLAQQILGADWESQILSGRIDILDSFAQSYFAIQQAIVDAAWNSANEQNKALASVGTGSTDGSGEITSVDYSQSGNSFSKKTSTNESTQDLRERQKKIYHNKMDALMKFHDGINKGYVGENISNDKRLSLLKSIANGNLLSDEIPAILQRGEVVLTEPQQSNLVNCLMQNSITPNISMPNFDYTKLGNRNDNSSFNVGDITVHCHGITSQEVAKEVGNALKNELFGMTNYAKQKMSITR